MRIGILGGTFNPIHNGHIKLAAGAKRKLKLDKVILVPVNIPPHKEAPDLLAAKERLKMARMAVPGNKYFNVSDYEVKSGGVSYSVKTLKAFRGKFGKTAKLFFLIGSDSLAQFKDWRGAPKLTRLAEFVVAKRPGYKTAGTKAVSVINIPTLNISSSDIRRRVKKGLTVKRLLPKAVLDYINKKGFYR